MVAAASKTRSSRTADPSPGTRGHVGGVAGVAHQAGLQRAAAAAATAVQLSGAGPTERLAVVVGTLRLRVEGCRAGGLCIVAAEGGEGANLDCGRSLSATAGHNMPGALEAGTA
ncbi:hypothetical protein GGTG_05875 [Gaeumannomyces tritici R3-111a-1]|uniref:Uncharacterized protein n=1 Tax=Gaeumannomyces tritici (strain R3-111a-1) TaxID=644352 RepID=J3NX68_GAET3|nr:hypothetical protein GGTG_05875 [Gaeumannomyces tritici R3-111a-1]EJT75950.1 hypothetical protein GGTG_05875 [Gaeumannomyces tritici R3-111a-1]